MLLVLMQIRVSLVILWMLVFVAPIAWSQTNPGPAPAPTPAALVITTDALPEISAGSQYHAQIQVTGGTLPYKWSVTSGSLPEGLALDPTSGTITGVTAKVADSRVTVQVTDSAVPAHSITREFSVAVIASLVFEWVKPPLVQNNRIDGSLRVANGSKSDFDLTVVVVGVNEIGRATALGYQHFKLKANSVGPDIPFGTTLPKGNYLVHADAVAEIAEKRQILKQQLQTPAPLKVAVGP
jgi:hypothetical protein